VAMKPQEVREAREFLRKRGIRGTSPRTFAQASNESGLSFKALLDFRAGVVEKVIDEYHGTKAVRKGGSA